MLKRPMTAPSNTSYHSIRKEEHGGIENRKKKRKNPKLISTLLLQTGSMKKQKVY